MGRACAEIMAMSLKKADEIWLIARRRERLEEFCKGLPSDKAAKIRIIDGDITGSEILESINSRLSKENPRIMFLVNAAGFGKIGSVARLSRDVQERMIKLNAEALLSMIRMCIPYMAEGTGRIINFASAAAFLPQPGFAVYAATKSFVLSFSEALDFELSKRGISVTAVCPGPVRTEFFDLAEEYGRIPVYKKLVMARPEAVVKKALRDSVKRKPVSVYGITMKGLRVLGAVVPHRLIFKIMGMFK